MIFWRRIASPSNTFEKDSFSYRPENARFFLPRAARQMPAEVSHVVEGGEEQAAARLPLVYFVILNYHGADLTIDCARSALATGYPNFKVLVVENGSRDDSVEVLRKAFHNTPVELLEVEENCGYAGGNNRGIERALAAGADYILLLNNDTIVNRGCLTPLVEAMERDVGLGIAGCPIIDLGPDPLASSRLRVNLITGGAAVWSGGEVDFISGAALLISADTARRVGVFDPRFFIGYEDTDLSFRARRAGYKVCVVPGPGVQHLGHRTINRFWPALRFYFIRNRAWFIRRHGTMKQRFAFNLYSFSYFYPRIILGRLIRRQFHVLPEILRAIWKGHCAYPGPYVRSPQ